MAGVTTIVDEADFDASRWLQILSKERINVWYTSPSALRRLMTLPLSACQEYDLSALRLIFSVGEPLHAAAVKWGSGRIGGFRFGTPGGRLKPVWIMIANHPQEPPQPGAMGEMCRRHPGCGAAPPLVHRQGHTLRVWRSR